MLRLQGGFGGNLLLLIYNNRVLGKSEDIFGYKFVYCGLQYYLELNLHQDRLM